MSTPIEMNKMISKNDYAKTI